VHLGTVQPADKLAQSLLRVDHGQLLDEHACRGASDLDLWAKRGSPASSRGRGNEPRRQGKVVGLDDDGEARANLLVAAGIRGCFQPVEITTHGSNQSLRPTSVSKPRPRDRYAGLRPPPEVAHGDVRVRLPRSP